MKNEIKSYIIKKNSTVLLLEVDQSRPDSKQCQVIDSPMAKRIFGLEKSFLIAKEKCSCGGCDDEFYIFRHMSGYLMQVDVNDVIETPLSVADWRKENQHLQNDLTSKCYSEKKQELDSYTN